MVVEGKWEVFLFMSGKLVLKFNLFKQDGDRPEETVNCLTYVQDQIKIYKVSKTKRISVFCREIWTKEKIHYNLPTFFSCLKHSRLSVSYTLESSVKTKVWNHLSPDITKSRWC